MTDAELRQLADEWSLYKTAMLYARAVDQNVPEIIDRIFTEDATIEMPGVRLKNRAEIRGVPAMLKQKYLSTTHAVHNQTVTIAGDLAEGETDCLAHLVTRGPRGGELVVAEAVRYVDAWVRRDGAWRFVSRRIVVEFSEIRAARHVP